MKLQQCRAHLLDSRFDFFFGRIDHQGDRRNEGWQGSDNETRLLGGDEARTFRIQNNANRLSADAFVSIHANSNKVHSVRGIETYYLDVTDDRDTKAA